MHHSIHFFYKKGDIMFGLTLAQWVSILAIAITGLLNAHPAPVFALALAKDVSGVDLEEFASAWLYGDSKPLAFTLSGK